MKIKNIKKLIQYLKLKFTDTKSVGQIVFVVIVLMISWSGIKSIQTNYQLQKQVSSIKQQNQIQKLENSNLALQNKYYDSSQYLELSARENFSLAAPGEKELIVPDQVALNYTVNVPASPAPNTSQTHEPGYQRDLSSWWNFFFNKQNPLKHS